MPTASSWPERLLSEKSDAVALQQIKERGAFYLWLIVVISVRQSTVAAISGLLPGAGYGQFEHKAGSLIAKFKEAGGTVREIDVWAESPRLSPLWLSASSSACHGLLIINDNAITYKAQRDKNARELKLANAAITDMQMRHADVAALDAKYTKELADAKVEMMLCVMMLPLVVVGCTLKQSVSQCVKPPPPPAWIMQPPPPTGRHRWMGLFHLRESGLITMQNNWKGTQKYINEQCR